MRPAARTTRTRWPEGGRARKMIERCWLCYAASSACAEDAVPWMEACGHAVLRMRSSPGGEPQTTQSTTRDNGPPAAAAAADYTIGGGEAGARSWTRRLAVLKKRGICALPKMPWKCMLRMGTPATVAVMSRASNLKPLRRQACWWSKPSLMDSHSLRCGAAGSLARYSVALANAAKSASAATAYRYHNVMSHTYGFFFFLSRRILSTTAASEYAAIVNLFHSLTTRRVSTPLPAHTVQM
mmetsp:Transcript_12528/g.31956  ORF Transcript_12528/g.31956 Transcript_12528/m.31956 type:complete len:240 (+) Transcript_12528:143-862(+)